ncbi:hypothetical protein ACIQYG_17990 [Peribacillus sp. NPDC096622]|uniref:hypothetical protein n=1 Tax=Peribacillus sp. NPDC096622 TaxID=3364396 RepID=UPI0038226EAB
MTITNKTNKKTIGEMTNSRMRWAFDPSTRIIKNKKGKGSYNRKKEQSYKGCSFLYSLIISVIRVIYVRISNKKDDPVLIRGSSFFAG